MPSEMAALVTDVTSSTIYQAYDTIRSVDTYYTNTFEQSTSTTLKLDQGNGNGAMAYTTSKGSTTKVIMDTSLNLPYDQHVANLSHELVHVHGKLIDSNNTIENSKFEENLADIYAYGICTLAGLSYTSHFVIPMTTTSLNNKYEGWQPYDQLPTFPKEPRGSNTDYVNNFKESLAYHPAITYYAATWTYPFEFFPLLY